jgi:hypothetical protein
MTICIDIGKFKATLKHDGSIGYRTREVEFDVEWVSCGVYQMSYYRPRDAANHEVLVTEDWYPPDTFISFTPEQFEKVAELYPSAPKQERVNSFKPFYEDFETDSGMFDLGLDTLFQAYKDPYPDVDRVYMVNHTFSHGAPTTLTGVLGLSWEDFNRLKDLLDSKKHEIFYSGCKIAGNPFSTLAKLSDA